MGGEGAPGGVKRGITRMRLLPAEKTERRIVRGDLPGLEQVKEEQTLIRDVAVTIGINANARRVAKSRRCHVAWS